jgi:hypothetical protein
MSALEQTEKRRSRRPHASPNDSHIAGTFERKSRHAMKLRYLWHCAREQMIGEKTYNRRKALLYPSHSMCHANATGSFFKQCFEPAKLYIALPEFPQYFRPWRMVSCLETSPPVPHDMPASHCIFAEKCVQATHHTLSGTFERLVM